MTGGLFDIEVSLALGADLSADPATWSWNTDITPWCMARDGGIRISRGRSDWQTTAQPSTCEVLVNNADGRFTRLNPLGAYFGQLNKNTPIRVRACLAGGALVTRFVGFISELPPRWEPGQTHYWVPIRADGVLRRLGLGSKPAKSYLHEVLDETNPLAYWPCEDPTGATAAGSAIPGVEAMAATAVLFAAGSPPTGALAAPDMRSGGVLVGRIPATAPPIYWSVQFAAQIAASGSTFTIAQWSANGSVAAWSVQVTSTQVNLLYTAAGVTSTAVALTTSLFDGEWHGFAILLQKSSADIFCTLEVDADINTATVSSQTFGQLGVLSAGGVTTGELLSIGHIAVNASDTFITAAVVALNIAGAGDFARARFTAVCNAAGIISDTSGTAATSVLLGSQTTNTVLGLLREIEAADSGLIVERLTGKLGYDPHDSRENLSVTLALDYNLGHISAPFEPADDDQATVNDVTVTRAGGSSAQVVDDASVAAVGRVDQGLTLSLYTDDQPVHNAGWRVNLGTVGEYRYPLVNLKLQALPMVGKIATWLACDIGSRVTISNLPTNITYDLVDQIIEGYTERIDALEWEVTLNLSPYKPYKIFVLGANSGDTSEFIGRIAGDANAAIRGAITNSATSIAFDPNTYRWTIQAAGLVLPGIAGSYASTPDNAALDVTGDIDIRADVTMATWTPAATTAFVAKWGVAGQRSYLFQVTTAGLLELAWSANGTAVSLADSTVAVPITEGRLAVRATLDVDNGAAGRTITFYTSTTIGGTWTQLGSAVIQATTTSIFAGTLAVEVGAQSIGTASMLTGTVHAAKILNGIAGTEVANPDFTIQTPGATSFADAAGRTWTVNGSGVIVESEFPFDARLGGEVVTVSSIATTPVTYVAGAAHVHADNAAVSPTIPASATTNDLLLILAAIRSSGTGTLTTPTGYTRLPVFASTDNVQLFAKVHSGSESTPTVTPSGGSAGDTVSAQMVAIRGTPTSLTDLADIVVASAAQLNASAQNVAYPGLLPTVEGCFVIACIWKQDDHTSTTNPSGFTHIDDPSTVVGNDQSLGWDYQIQRSPAVVNEGSIVVTGGASAISRSAVFALAAGYQTATVTRSVNGVTKAHSAATKIEVEDASFVLGL